MPIQKKPTKRLAEERKLPLTLRRKLRAAGIRLFSDVVKRNRLGFLEKVSTITPRELAALERELLSRKLVFAMAKNPQDEAFTANSYAWSGIDQPTLTVFWKQGIFSPKDLSKISIYDLVKLLRRAHPTLKRDQNVFGGLDLEIRVRRILILLRERRLDLRRSARRLDRQLRTDSARVMLAVRGIDSLQRLYSAYGKRVRYYSGPECDPGYMEIVYLLHMHELKKARRRKRPRR